MDPRKKRIRDVVKLAQRVQPLAPTGRAGPGRGHKKKPKDRPTQGNRSEYLMRRIKRDHPDILARCLAGEFVSVRAAAVAAGIIKGKTGDAVSGQLLMRVC